MAYRLRRGEPIRKGLARVVNKELRSAVDELSRPPSSAADVHEARKRIKKVRAVVQLVGPVVGAGRDGKRLRRAGHALAPLRDAEAMRDSLEVFCRRNHGTLSAEACAAIEETLNRHHQQLTHEAERDDAYHTIALTLSKVRQSARGWALAKARFDAVSDSIASRYKKAQSAMERAQAKNGPDDFHRWRKRVKTLWYALRLLQRRVPSLRRETGALARLEALLGEHHNVQIFKAHVLATRYARDNPFVATRIRILCEKRHADLRRRALSMGDRLFEATPKAFARSLRASWKDRDPEPARRSRARRSTRGAAQGRRVPAR